MKSINVRYLYSAAIVVFTLFSLSANAVTITPRSNWADSYSVNGKCYCASSFDHGIGSYTVDTPAGRKTVREVCQKIGPGPGKGSNPVYNTVQCGHEPGHDDSIRIGGKLVKDEKECPGRVDLGSAGCNQKGPKWDLSVFGNPPTESNNLDINSTINGASVSVTVVPAIAISRVKEVKLYIDGVFVRREIKSPYTWNVTAATNDTLLTNLSSGSHTLKAVLTDTSNKVSEETEVIVIE